jgi:uncharacterized protein YoxC
MDHLVTAAVPGPGERILLLFTRALFLTAFFTCAFELMLSLLQRLGVPTLTLRQVRRTFNKVRPKPHTSTAGSSGAWWLAIKSIVLEPQFLLTLIIGAGAGATAVATAPGPGATDFTKQLQPVWSQLSALDQHIGQLQTPLQATSQRLDSLVTAVTEIKANLPDKELTRTVLQRLDSVDQSLGGVELQVDRLTTLETALSRDISHVSVGVGKAVATTTDLEAAVKTHSDALSQLRSTLESVRTSVKETATAVGPALRRHPWNDSSNAPTIGSEIYRLVQHEDTLDKRISRLVAHDELRKVLEGSWGVTTQTAQVRPSSEDGGR